MKEKVFKDPVYDYIYVYDSVILELIDTKEMQRLRRIKQLGVSYLTYHGAEHSRFAHSLGTYEVMRRILEGLDKREKLHLSQRDQLLCKVCALVHDLGHGPFSHSSEEVFGIEHETWTIEIIKGDTEVNSVLKKIDRGFPDQVASVIRGDYTNQLVVSLVSSQLDADRIDYLLRDSLATGVNYGQLDLERIIRIIEPTEDEILFKEDGMHSIESYILARYSMYWQVYLHPTTRSAEIVLKKTFKRAKELYQSGVNIYLPSPLEALMEDQLDVKFYLEIDEPLIWYTFKYWTDSSDSILADLSSRIIYRKLFKRVKCEVDSDLYRVLYQYFNEVGINPDYYLMLDTPSNISYNYYQPEERGSKVPIRLIDKRGNISELSQLSKPVQAIAGKKEIKYNIYYPRDLILEGKGEGYEKIREVIGR